MQDYEKYYSNLLIWQYKAKPKIEGLIKAMVSELNLFSEIEEVRTAFDIKTATKAQLLRLADYAGLPLIDTILNLDEKELRDLVSLQIIINNSNASGYSINASLFEVFGYDLLMKTNNDMSMFYFATLPNNLLEIAIANDLLPRPAGVAISIIDSQNSSCQLISAFDYNETAGLDKIGSDGLGGFIKTNEIINY
tara:strand:- start:2495 stop:3076 length:582 start_codon:yes stop_codon:yes gene_type:complete